jgi:hypothetical protein
MNTSHIFSIDSNMYLKKTHINNKERFFSYIKTLPNVSIKISDTFDITDYEEFFLHMYPSEIYNGDIFYINRYLKSEKLTWPEESFTNSIIYPVECFSNIIPGMWAYIISTAHNNHYILFEDGNINYYNKPLSGTIFNGEIITSTVLTKFGYDTYYIYEYHSKDPVAIKASLSDLSSKYKIKILLAAKATCNSGKELQDYINKHKNVYIKSTTFPAATSSSSTSSSTSLPTQQNNRNIWVPFNLEDMCELYLLFLSTPPNIQNFMLKNKYVLMQNGTCEYSSQLIHPSDINKIIKFHKLQKGYDIFRLSNGNDELSVRNGMIQRDGIICKFYYNNNKLILIGNNKYKQMPDSRETIKFKTTYKTLEWFNAKLLPVAVGSAINTTASQQHEFADPNTTKIYKILTDEYKSIYNIYYMASNKYLMDIFTVHDQKVSANLCKNLNIYTHKPDLFKYLNMYKNIHRVTFDNIRKFDAPECDLIILDSKSDVAQLSTDHFVEKIFSHSDLYAKLLILDNTNINGTIKRYFKNQNDSKNDSRNDSKNQNDSRNQHDFCTILRKRVTYFMDNNQLNNMGNTIQSLLHEENPHVSFMRYEKYTRSKLEEFMLSKLVTGNSLLENSVNDVKQHKYPVDGVILSYIEFLTITLSSKRKPISINTVAIRLDGVNQNHIKVLQLLFPKIKHWWTSEDQVDKKIIENIVYMTGSEKLVENSLTIYEKTHQYAKALILINKPVSITTRCSSYKFYTIPYGGGDSMFLSINYSTVNSKNILRDIDISTVSIIFKNFYNYYSKCIFKYKLPIGFENIFDNCYGCRTFDNIILKYVQFSEKVNSYNKIYEILKENSN